MYHIDSLPDDIEKGTKFKTVNGVPYTKIPYTSECHPHATNIACYVIRFGDEKSARWLLDNMDEKGRIWHHFKFPYYENFTEPWVGGLAQGLTISALVKMYESTKNNFYLDGALLAYEGLKTCTKGGWIYEYPNVRTILNGNLYALLGVWDLIKDHKRKEKKKFFDDVTTNISRSLHYFEIGYGWTYYDLEQKLPATRFYHKIHVDLLRVFSVITSNNAFSLYELKWAKYLDGYNSKYADIHRLWKIWRRYGTLGVLKRRKIRKRWLNES